MTYAHNGQYLRYYATNIVGDGYSNTVRITVNRFNLSLSLSCEGITYNQTPNPQLTGNTGGGTVTYEYKVQGAQDGDYTSTVPTNAGDYTVRAVVAATNTYNAASATAGFSITKATPVMNLTASPIGGSLADDTVTLTAALTGVSVSDTPTGSIVFKNGGTVLGTVSIVNGEASCTWQNVPYGDHHLTAEYAGDGNYQSATGSISSYDVQKKAQGPLSITGLPQSLIFGGSSFSLGAEGGNGSGSVTYTVQSGDAVSVSGNTVTIEKAGTAVIQATKASDDIYNEISVVITIAIAKAMPTIQANPSVNRANAGTTLSTLSLSALKAYGIGGTPLAGSFAWQNPQTVIRAAGTFTAIFTPDNGNYEAASFEVQVNLDATKPVIVSIKATPSINGARLEVTASAGTPLTYQWQVQGSWLDIPGATTAVFDYTGLEANKSYTVRVIVTDGNGNVTTSDAITFKTGAQAITGLPGSYTLINGQSVSFTPNPAGGTWSYDKNYITMKQDGDKATFTANKVGKTSVTYTAGGTEHVVQITINSSTIPQTGDAGSLLPFVLLGLSALLGMGAVVFKRKRRDA